MVVRRLTQLLGCPNVLPVAEEYRVEEVSVGVGRPLNENPSSTLPPLGVLDQFLRSFEEDLGSPLLALLAGFNKALQKRPVRAQGGLSGLPGCLLVHPLRPPVIH